MGALQSETIQRKRRAGRAVRGEAELEGTRSRGEEEGKDEEVEEERGREVEYEAPKGHSIDWGRGAGGGRAEGVQRKRKKTRKMWRSTMPDLKREVGPHNAC